MTTTEPAMPADAIGPTTTIDARRIGLLGDDHNIQDDGSDLPDEVLEAFAGVDAILHLGHMGQREKLARGVLDRLGEIAPVHAVQDFWVDAEGERHLTPADGDRVRGITRVYEVDGVRIGMVHNLAVSPGPAIPTPAAGVPELDGVDLDAVLPEKFGGPVDVVAFAGSHRAVVAQKQGVLFVNPGSPTFPKGPGRVPGKSPLGTVGVLEVAGGATTFELVELAALREQRSWATA